MGLTKVSNNFKIRSSNMRNLRPILIYIQWKYLRKLLDIFDSYIIVLFVGSFSTEFDRILVLKAIFITSLPILIVFSAEHCLLKVSTHFTRNS